MEGVALVAGEGAAPTAKWELRGGGNAFISVTEDVSHAFKSWLNLTAFWKASYGAHTRQQGHRPRRPGGMVRRARQAAGWVTVQGRWPQGVGGGCGGFRSGFAISHKGW